MRDFFGRLRAIEREVGRVGETQYPLLVEVEAGEPAPATAGPRTLVVELGPAFVPPPTEEPGE